MQLSKKYEEEKAELKKQIFDFDRATEPPVRYADSKKRFPPSHPFLHADGDADSDRASRIGWAH